MNKTKLFQPNHIDGNKKLLDFMGTKVEKDDETEYYWGTCWYPHRTNNTWNCGQRDEAGVWERLYSTGNRFHEDWGWLMEVLRKIKNFLNNMPERPSRNHCCQGDLLEVDIQCALWELDIEKTWAACVAFVDWYNDYQTKKEQPNETTT